MQNSQDASREEDLDKGFRQQKKAVLLVSPKTMTESDSKYGNVKGMFVESTQ